MKKSWTVVADLEDEEKSLFPAKPWTTFQHGTIHPNSRLTGATFAYAFRNCRLCQDPLLCSLENKVTKRATVVFDAEKNIV